VVDAHSAVGRSVAGRTGLAVARSQGEGLRSRCLLSWLYATAHRIHAHRAKALRLP